MRVRLSHTTRLDYNGEAIEGIMDVRLGPCSDGDQRWLRFDLVVAPNATVNRYRDGFGNTAYLISLRRPHHSVEVISGGEVETLLDDPFAVPARSPMPLTLAEQAEYLTPSTLVPRSATLSAMAEPFRQLALERPFDALAELMHLVHAEFVYEQIVTNVFTTVAEVVESRRGVCQDFAHVLIGLCRSLGIPARYVSGYRDIRARASAARSVRVACLGGGVHSEPRLARL